MITFVIKSAICLTILYGFYRLFLWNIKAFNFIRFYLLFSLLFSFIIPLITIRIKLNSPANLPMNGVSSITGIISKGFEVIKEPIQYLTVSETLIIIYCIITSILILRFVLNVLRILKIVRTSPKINNFKTQIVLIEKKASPYSFFRYIFVNRSDYEQGKIEEELIIHEQTHCLQYHSVDILIIEFVKIILWFNPILWFFRKAIQLNHEFLADNKVLMNNNLNDYQNTLVNFVFRNNSTYLASNFNYSSTKKRLIMMSKNNSASRIKIIKLATVSLFVMLGISLTFSQVVKHTGIGVNNQNEWWYPILNKLNIEPHNFNNYDNMFQMFSKSTNNDHVITFEDAFFLIKLKINNKEKFYIVKSKTAYHDLNKKIITCKGGTMEEYKFDNGNAELIEKTSFEQFIMGINDNKVSQLIEKKFKVLLN